MEAPAVKYASVDQYIASCSAASRLLLKELRKTVMAAAPAAEEIISYNMPALRLNGMLVYYAAFKNHIGFYPGVGAIKAFKKEISGYKSAKGSVQFPIDQPMPLPLIKKIVLFKIKENESRQKVKGQKSKN